MLGWRGAPRPNSRAGKRAAGAGGAGPGLAHGRAGPLGREKWMGAGGCQSFGELFHLRLYNPAVPPTERGSRAGPHDPPTAGGGTAQAACSSSWSFCFPRTTPPPPLVFLILFFFFFFSELEKKTTKRARAAACSGACSASKRQSSPTFPLPPQLRAPQTSAMLEPKSACRSTPL